MLLKLPPFLSVTNLLPPTKKGFYSVYSLKSRNAKSRLFIKTPATRLIRLIRAVALIIVDWALNKDGTGVGWVVLNEATFQDIEKGISNETIDKE